MKFFKDALFSLMGLILLVAALEGGLRLARDRTDGSVFQAEADRGVALRPGAEGWNVFDGEAWVHINGDGMRDRERVLPRPADSLRIAVVGASTVESEQVELPETFEALMEKDLNTSAELHGRHVEVLNFGVEAYTFGQTYLTVRNHIWKYDPRVVVLVESPLSVLKSVPGMGAVPSIPFFRLNGGHLEPDEAASARPALNPHHEAMVDAWHELMNRSYLLCLLNQAKRRLPVHLAAARELVRRTPPPGVNEPPPDFITTWPYLPDLPQTQQAWAVTEALVREMRDECKRHGAEFFFFVADMNAQSHPDPAVRATFAGRLGISSLDLSDRRFESFGAANGIPVFPLAPVVRGYAQTHQIALHGNIREYNEGHWNPLGHQIVAPVITDFLRKHSQVLNDWLTPDGSK